MHFFEKAIDILQAVCYYNGQKGGKRIEQAKARKAAEREAEADERERVTGMRQSKTAMLVKIVVGVLFLFAAVSLAIQGNISSFVCGLVIVGALVAWGLVPYLKAKSGRR